MARSCIIRDLASGKVSVDIGLKQLKVLLTEFDKPEMLKWVNAELQGYDDEDDLPEYRIIAGNLVGNFLNYYTKCTHIGIPLIYAASISTLVAFLFLTIFRYVDSSKYVNAKIDKVKLIRAVIIEIGIMLVYYKNNTVLNLVAFLTFFIYAIKANYGYLYEMYTKIKHRKS